MLGEAAVLVEGAGVEEESGEEDEAWARSIGED